MEEYKNAVRVLLNLRKRILNAAKHNKGCRITAEEAELLTVFNLPITAEEPFCEEGEENKKERGRDDSD